MELEVFVHGALCVSYSGQCYLSQYAAGRSGNRGVCAQLCRHKYSLINGSNQTVLDNKYPLSLKDMNRLESIGDLVAAGVTSFKIEGRYKEIEYVKNITALYRLVIDEYIAAHSQYRRESSGTCTFGFKPDPEKTFNRGFTGYFIEGKREKIAAMDTPKSIGKFIGRIVKPGRNFFRLQDHDLRNGDGICFFNRDSELTGFKVERVAGNKIYPNTMTGLTAGTELYRNSDTDFLSVLRGSAHCRAIDVEMIFNQGDKGIRLTVKDEDGVTVEISQEAEFQPAQNPQRARSVIETQLMRTGDTPYRVRSVTIYPDQPGFLALSIINDIRRRALTQLTQARIPAMPRPEAAIITNNIPYPEKEVDYRANILNTKALAFYKKHGVEVREMALESESDGSVNNKFSRVLMTTRYCLRYELDACLKSANRQNNPMIAGPLRIGDRQHTYRLEFDCKACRMLIMAESGF